MSKTNSLPILYLANKNYSSWSMRAWLAAKFVGLNFEEKMIPLRQENTVEEIAKISPSGKVPCLHIDGIAIWDSLAIAEYLNELFPAKNLFAADQKIRAIQRSVISEMHSGFMDLRKELPMNMKFSGPIIPNVGAQNNIERILETWRFTRQNFSNNQKFLFGKFSIADIFFAPVVSRFISYQIEVKDQIDYLKNISEFPLYQEWQKAALKEEWEIADYLVKR